MDAIFALSNWVVLPFWALAICAPGWRWSERLIGSPWIAAPAALVYAALVVPRLGGVLEFMSTPGGPQLAQIAALLGTPEGALIAWAHLVAFDLFSGRWIYLDARGRGVPWWISSPVLFAVFIVGPLGLLSYLGLRELWRPAGSPAA